MRSITDHTSADFSYLIKKERTRMQSRFNRYIHMMARGGMPRNRMLFRWLGQSRYMQLMQNMSRQLQRGDDRWIGSLHTIVGLVHQAATKVGYKIPKQDIRNIAKHAQSIMIKDYKPPVHMRKCLDKINNREYKNEAELVKAVSEALGGFVAYSLLQAIESRNTEIRETDKFQSFTKAVKEQHEAARAAITQIAANPFLVRHPHTNPINSALENGVPVASFVHVLSSMHNKSRESVQAGLSALRRANRKGEGVTTEDNLKRQQDRLNNPLAQSHGDSHHLTQLTLRLLHMQHNHPKYHNLGMLLDNKSHGVMLEHQFEDRGPYLRPSEVDPKHGETLSKQRDRIAAKLGL